VLLGQINRIYGKVAPPGAAAAAPLGRTYRGRVGFIVE
jgi:pilus assembly protein CpaC